MNKKAPKFLQFMFWYILPLYISTLVGYAVLTLESSFIGHLFGFILGVVFIIVGLSLATFFEEINT